MDTVVCVCERERETWVLGTARRYQWRNDSDGIHQEVICSGDLCRVVDVHIPRDLGHNLSGIEFALAVSGRIRIPEREWGVRTQECVRVCVERERATQRLLQLQTTCILHIQEGRVYTYNSMRTYKCVGKCVQLTHFTTCQAESWEKKVNRGNRRI